LIQDALLALLFEFMDADVDLHFVLRREIGGGTVG
jgi:hypothetical protein